MAEQERVTSKYVRGVWMAYYSDFSEAVPFRDEIVALRYALANSMQVVFVPFGRSPRDAVKEADAAARVEAEEAGRG